MVDVGAAPLLEAPQVRLEARQGRDGGIVGDDAFTQTGGNRGGGCAGAPAGDGGRFPVRRMVGDAVRGEADVFADGHDRVAATLLYRHEGEFPWHKVPMRPLGNDRWAAEFTAELLGGYLYSVEGRIDHFATWRADLRSRFEAGQNLGADREIGARLLEAAASRAGRLDAGRLRELAAALREAPDDAAALALAEEEEIAELMALRRQADLKKPPSIAESLDWARTLLTLGATELTDDLTRQTLSVLLKYERDIDTAMAELRI